MKNIEENMYKRYFLRFLKKNDIFEEFALEYKEEKDNEAFGNFFRNQIKSNKIVYLINNALWWDKTRRGFSFYRQLQYKWVREYQKIKNEIDKMK